ncbi:hypothetical protein CYMTET_2637 [Cymbomonas tetramitiformis]|uniref:Uncharacterized protein n=1 Tax=Cymbomonas tetramitiformis TaxID=36881 RepID=A0AAE0LLS7_9CHLO|nr:hypothetical protein CYMTET_2637 [Cymbomonas tetramitiformis]|eukprot:gene6407-7676_t
MPLSDAHLHSMDQFTAADADWLTLRAIAQNNEVIIRNALLLRDPARLSKVEIRQAALHGSIRVLLMYAEEFDPAFHFTAETAEMALRSGNLECFKWGVRRTMDRALRRGGDRDPDETQWNAWFDAVRYMTVVAARAGRTEALNWMLTGAYSDHFDNPFPEFCLYTEAASNMHWGTVRFLLQSRATGIRCEDTRKALFGLVRKMFITEKLDAAIDVLERAFEEADVEAEKREDKGSGKRTRVE